MTRKKLCCSCLDDKFTGIPCRHLIALVCKEPSLGFETLPFQRRWEITYYKEEDQDPNEIYEENEDKNDIGETQEIIIVIIFLF